MFVVYQDFFFFKLFAFSHFKKVKKNFLLNSKNVIYVKTRISRLKYNRKSRRHAVNSGLSNKGLRNSINNSQINGSKRIVERFKAC